MKQAVPANKRRLNVYLERGIMVDAKIYAVKNDVTLTRLIETALRAYISADVTTKHQTVRT